MDNPISPAFKFPFDVESMIPDQGDIRERIQAGEQAIVEALKDIVPQVTKIRQTLYTQITGEYAGEDYSDDLVSTFLRVANYEVGLRQTLADRGLSWNRHS